MFLGGLILAPASVALAEEPEWKPAPWGRELDDEILRAKKAFHGAIAVYTSDPRRGFRHGFNADNPSYLASGVKIAFMLEVFRQAHKGELSLDEELVYGPDDARDGAPILNRQEFGKRFTIRQLLAWMMESSDNAASDLLIKRVGLDRINRGLREEGLNGFTPLSRMIDVRLCTFRELDVHADDLNPIQVLAVRKAIDANGAVFGPQAAKLEALLGRPKGTFKPKEVQDAFDRFYETGVNSAKLEDIGRIFERLLRGELVSPEASKQMLALMSNTKTSRHRILGMLPADVKVIHKTGSQQKRMCDLGIIELPDGAPLVFATCFAGPVGPAAEQLIAKLARKTYDLVLADHQRARAGRAR